MSFHKDTENYNSWEILKQQHQFATDIWDFKKQFSKSEHWRAGNSYADAIMSFSNCVQLYVLNLRPVESEKRNRTEFARFDIDRMLIVVLEKEKTKNFTFSFRGRNLYPEFIEMTVVARFRRCFVHGIATFYCEVELRRRRNDAPIKTKRTGFEI